MSCNNQLNMNKINIYDVCRKKDINKNTSVKSKKNNIIPIITTSANAILDESTKEVITTEFRRLETKPAKPESPLRLIISGPISAVDVVSQQDEEYKLRVMPNNIHIKNNNNKNLLCCHIYNNGECKYGNKCNFAHSIKEQYKDEIFTKIYNLLDMIIEKKCKKGELHMGKNVYNKIKIFTKICTLYMQNTENKLMINDEKKIMKQCIGGYNCTYGVHNMKYLICLHDYMFGFCRKSYCNKLHISEYFINYTEYIKRKRTIHNDINNNSKNITQSARNDHLHEPVILLKTIKENITSLDYSSDLLLSDDDLTIDNHTSVLASCDTYNKKGYYSDHISGDTILSEIPSSSDAIKELFLTIQKKNINTFNNKLNASINQVSYENDNISISSSNLDSIDSLSSFYET